MIRRSALLCCIGKIGNRTERQQFKSTDFEPVSWNFVTIATTCLHGYTCCAYCTFKMTYKEIGCISNAHVLPSPEAAKRTIFYFPIYVCRKPTGPPDNYKISIQTGSDPAGTAAIQPSFLPWAVEEEPLCFTKSVRWQRWLVFPSEAGFALHSPLLLPDIKTFPSAQARSQGRTCGKRSVCELSRWVSRERKRLLQIHVPGRLSCYWREKAQESTIGLDHRGAHRLWFG